MLDGAMIRLPRSAVVALALAAALTLPGCADAAIEWRYELDDATAASTAALEGRILRDGCGGAELAAYRFPPGEEPGTRPPALEAGSYGFEIEAFDAECRPVGRGCSAVTLPSDAETVLVRVEALEPAEAPRCRADRCEAGRCRPGS
jgi:hypothetical protein